MGIFSKLLGGKPKEPQKEIQAKFIANQKNVSAQKESPIITNASSKKDFPKLTDIKQIEFNVDTVDINLNNGDISGKYITSPNGMYHFLADTFYTKNGNGTEVVVVFTDKDVIYKKKITNDATIYSLDLCRVFDDRSCAYLTDEEYFVILDSTGKQIAKRKVPCLTIASYHDHFFWAFGDNDDGDGTIFVFDLQEIKSYTRKLPDIKHTVSSGDDEETEEFFGSDADVILHDEHIVVGYRDAMTCLCYDFALKQVPPSETERTLVFEVQKEKVEKERREKEAKKAERAAYEKQKSSKII